MNANRVLVVANDLIPLPGGPTTGAGLRAWGLGQGLAASGFQVAFAVPQVILQGRSQPPDLELYSWDPTTLQSVVDRADPAVVVFCHWPALALQARLRRPTVIDFHGPHLLERQWQRLGNQADNVRAKLFTLRMADFFTCAGDKQWAYFRTWLQLAGVNDPERRLSVVPVAFDPRLPARRSPTEEPLLVSGGVFLPWQDPLPGLEAAGEALAEVGRGRLEIYGGLHPVQPISAEPLQRAQRVLARFDRVHFRPMLGHDELLDIYAGSTAMIEVMAHNLERELAFTTRTAESLWCGLPVVYNDYAEIARLIREYEAGWCVDPTDPAAIRAAIRTVLTDPAEVARRSANARRLARERLAWDQAVRPLADFCRAPSIRPESPMPALSAPPPPPPGKSFGQLVDEAIYHYRTGGIGAVARNTAGFVRKRLQ